MISQLLSSHSIFILGKAVLSDTDFELECVLLLFQMAKQQQTTKSLSLHSQIKSLVQVQHVWRRLLQGCY